MHQWTNRACQSVKATIYPSPQPKVSVSLCFPSLLPDMNSNLVTDRQKSGQTTRATKVIGDVLEELYVQEAALCHSGNFRLQKTFSKSHYKYRICFFRLPLEDKNGRDTNSQIRRLVYQF